MWADTTVGATDYTTGYLGAKSAAYAINSNGTWTFEFTNHNNEGGDYANFLLECNNGTRDEFVLRADNFETVRWANNDITTTYAGSDLDKDLNGTSVVMTVTRNGYHIAVSATITPTTETAAFTYTYDFYRASGDLNLYLSVDHSYLTITNASWEASAGTITETKIVNLPDFTDGTLFDNASRITVSKDAGYNNLKFVTAGNSTNGYSLSKFDFSSLIGDDAAAVKITFLYFIPNGTSNYQRGFTFGQADLRTGFAKQSYTSNGGMFFFGLSRNSSHNYFSINKASTVDAQTVGDAIPAETQGLLGAWATAEVMIDLVKRTVSYKIIGSSIIAGYDIAYMNSSEKLAKCNQIDFYDCANNTTSYLSNLVITKYVDSEASAYSVVAVDGENNTLDTYAAGMYKSGVTNKTLSWDRYINVSDQWYGPSSCTNCTLTLLSGGTTKITYPTSSIDYYFDEAQLSKTHSWATGADKAYMSRGRGESLYANSTAYTSTLDAGVYEMVIGAATRNGSPTLKYGYRLSDTNTQLGTTAAWNNGSYAATQTFKNIVIPEGASLCFYIDGGPSTNSNVLIDYVTLTKVSNVTATIGSTGYTTFASSYAMNLDGMTASTGTVKAYYVTASNVKNSSVALTDATVNVPAGTGLILEGTAGATITIPVVAAGTALSGNILVGCTTATDITSATENYDNFYVLSATEAAFKKIKTWVDTPHTLTIPAGKAYLDTTGAGVVGAPTLNFDLSGEATGIADVRGKMEDVRSDFFDLQGRKVAQPAKGLYIVNGKKVVIK